MQPKPTPGDARDRIEASPPEKSTPCARCDDPADGHHATLDRPVCRDCARRTGPQVDLLAALFDAVDDVPYLAETCRVAGIDDRLVHAACEEPTGDRGVRADGGDQGEGPTPRAGAEGAVRCDGGEDRDRPVDHFEALDERRTEALERQADALETIADELGYLNGAATILCEDKLDGNWSIESIAEEIDGYRRVRDREVLRR